MISEFFLNIIFQLLEWLLRMLPDISFSADWGTTSTFFGVVNCKNYLGFAAPCMMEVNYV